MNPPKFRNSAGKPSKIQETVAVSSSMRPRHQRRMGSHIVVSEG